MLLLIPLPPGNLGLEAAMFDLREKLRKEAGKGI